MNARPHPKLALVSLCLLAGIAAVLWRAEVEYHGWAGLTWIGYFHWAVPAGVGLFIAWLAVFSGITPLWRRALFLVTAGAFAVVAYRVSYWALWHYFHPLGWMFSTPNPSKARVELYLGAVYLVYPGVPVCACLIARLFGVRLKVAHWLLTVVLFVAACPFAVGMLHLTDHAGKNNPIIHTIKSGFIIPLLVIGLGVPFLWPGRSGRRPVPRGSKPPTDEREPACPPGNWTQI